MIHDRAETLKMAEQVTLIAPQRVQDITYTVTSAEARLDPAWDARVEAAPGGDLAQTTAWAATRQRLGHRVCHLRVSAADGRPVGGCLIQFRHVLSGVQVGAVPRGPLLFTEKPDAAGCVVREMIAAAQRLGIRLLVVQPPEGSTTLLEAMAAAGFQAGGPNIVPDATIRIDLRCSEEEILRNLNSNRRRRVREVMRSGFETGSSNDVETFHRLYVASAKRQGFRPISIENLKAQWEVLAPLGMCRIFITRHDGVPVAGEWVMSFAGVLTSKFTGYDLTQVAKAARSAPTALKWGCVLQGKKERARHFDFGGFDREIAEDLVAGREPSAAFTESPNYFKWSFGGEIALLPQPQFILTGRLARLALTGVAQRLLTSHVARQLAQRIRTAR